MIYSMVITIADDIPIITMAAVIYVVELPSWAFH